MRVVLVILCINKIPHNTLRDWYLFKTYENLSKRMCGTIFEFQVAGSGCNFLLGI